MGKLAKKARAVEAGAGGAVGGGGESTGGENRMPNGSEASDVLSGLSKPKAVLCILAALVGFVAVVGVASLLFDIPNELISYPLNAAARVLGCLALVALLCNRALHVPIAALRYNNPRPLAPWLLLAIALPAAVSAFVLLFVPGSLGFARPSATQTVSILVNAICLSGLAAGFSEELVFRGFIMRVLEAKWGRVIAVLLPSVVFGLLHIGNMQEFDLADVLLLVVAGTAVGVLFSVVAIASGSLVSSMLMHGVWNVVIIGEILSIGAVDLGAGASIFRYTLDPSVPRLLTGGAFGIEASLPAIIGYALATAAALLLGGRHKRMR